MTSLTRRAALGLLAALPAAPAFAQSRRIVSIGGAVTEIIYALGMGGNVVAVDSTSTWPPEARALPGVGYMRQLSAEPIIAMAPDLVLATDSSGPAAALAQLRDAGTRLEVVADPPSADGVAPKVRQVAALLDKAAQGEAMADAIDARLASLGQAIALGKEHPSVLFLMSAGRGAPMAAGGHTAAQAMITLAGGRNAVTGYDGYKPLTPEAAVLAAPDLILAMDQTVEAIGGPAAVLALAELRDTPAAKAGRLVAMEGQLLLGFGPRTPDALRALAMALHPGLALPE
jgi:iron complex transport system substrate-binding protein